MSVISRVPTIPLQWLICNFVKRTDDDLHEVVASLKDETLDVARRRTLFTLFEAKRQQLVRLLVLVRFLHHGQPQLDRLRDLFTILDTREQMYAYAFDTARVLETHVEQRLTPMWDVFTALHVMTTGSYRLLPKSIETAVGFKKKVNPDTITRTLHRLNDQLHIRLLGTKVPQQFTAIRIEEGMAYLTVPGEFEVGISLRMAPPSVPPVENETEESRINWRLFQLKILIGMERAGKGKEKGKSSTFALVNDSQIAHLLGYLNHMMFSHPDPIMILYQRCHAFCISLVMDLLYRQAQMLEHQFGHAIQIDYTRHRCISLYYWRSAPLIPIEGRIPEIDSAREKLRLCIMIDEHQEWSVRHTPPLPAMEMTKQQGWKLDRHGVPIASQPSPTITTQSPFRITPSCLSLSRLFAHTLTAHAHHRLVQLHTYIPRICQDARIHAYADITLHQSGDGDDMHTELHITLIAHRIIVITCESSTGRFLLTWKGTHTPHDISSNGTRIARLAVQRVLEQQQDKINANVTIIGDILMELRSHAELEEMSTQVELMGWIAYRHPALIWPDTITPLPSHTLYIRLLTSPHYFLAITLSKQQHTYYFIQTTPNAFDLKSNQPIPSTRGQMSNSRIVQIGSAICLIESCTPIPMMDIDSDMNIHKNNINNNTNININISIHKKSHEWDLLRYVIAYAERKIPSCVLARQLKAQHFEFTHHHRTIKLQRQWAPTSGSAIAYLQSITTTTQHDVLRMQFTILQPSNSLQLTHQWIAQISHPAITLVSRYLTSSNQLPHHIQYDVRDDLIPDAKIFIYQSVEKSSIHTFLHDLTCFLRMVNVALDVDAYNMKPRRLPDKQDQFPSKFFELQSIDSRQLVIAYPISTHEQRATITFKQRDIDRISSRSSRSSRSTTYLTLTFYPLPFPQRLWYEAEFNAHHNLVRLLTHIYHAYKAMGAIVQFMKHVKHVDMMAGFQYFPTQHFPRTVSLLPESSSRLRLLYRKSNETCTDLRMLHHDAILQDFMAKQNAASFEPLKDPDSSIIDMTHDTSEKTSNMTQPGLIMMDNLYSYLSQWYRRCAQLEWWKKSQRLMKNMNQRMEFIFVRTKEIELGIMIQFISHEILTSQQQSILITYWSRYVAAAPYPLESLDAYVRILCLPKSMLSSLLDVIAIHIQPDTSRPLQPRLILHLSVPLHLEWDQTSSILYLTLELVDTMGSQSMYLPLSYHERLNLCCIWEYQVNTRQKSSRWRITPTDGSTSLVGIIQWLCTMDMNTLMQWMMNGLPTQPYNTISTAPQLPVIAPQQSYGNTAALLQPLLTSR